MNVLLLTSHAIAEHDDLDMFTRMGVPVYSIGGAYDDVPFEGKRPAVPNVIRYPELEAATNAQRERMGDQYGDPGSNIDWAKARLAPEVIDWADTVIVHHFPEQWIGGNWDALDGRRIIWRTCGQSDPRLETVMSRYRQRGLEIVRYSPKEAEAFTRWGVFAGEDDVIRFGKDPAEWYGWTGEDAVVGNITQHMAQRGDACGYDYWAYATRGLPTKPAGPGSEVIGGLGELDYDDMRAYLRSIRVYLYTGTRPASYTLGLIEAMMTGVPVVSITPEHFQPSELFEGHTIAGNYGSSPRSMLENFLRLGPGPEDAPPGYRRGDATRARAIELFGLDGIMVRWREYLGLPVPWIEPEPVLWGPA